MKKKVKRVQKTSKKKKLGLTKGNEFLIPRYIEPKETMLQKVWRWLNEYAFNMDSQ